MRRSTPVTWQALCRTACPARSRGRRTNLSARRSGWLRASATQDMRAWRNSSTGPQPAPSSMASAPPAWWRAEWRSPARSWPRCCSPPSRSPRRPRPRARRGRGRWSRPRPEPLPSAEGVELARYQAQPALLAAAQHDHLDGNVDQVGDHQALYVVDALDARAGELDDQILRSEPRPRGGAIGHDLDDLHAAGLAPLATGPRGQRARASGDAEVGSQHATVGHERADHLAGGVVDGHGEPK